MHQPVRARNDKGVSAASCGIDRLETTGAGPPSGRLSFQLRTGVHGRW